MKNTQLYPFERNKYFYGKLLSVEDFNAEQKYTNDKRRLLNRLIHGMGVVCGLNVVRVDEETISVESGLALDATGREIVVAPPVTKKLAMINGYDAAMSEGCGAYVYLCIEYTEKEKGNAHNIAADSGTAVSDRIREGYDLYLTAAEPDDDLDMVSGLYEREITVFRDRNLQIKHVMPRYVNPDSTFEFRIEVENFTKQLAAFSYDIQLVCLNSASDGSSVLKVRFDEMLLEKTGKYTLSFLLRANNVNNTEGTATIDPSTFSLSYDKNSAGGDASGRSSVMIIDGNVEDAVTAGNFDYSLDTALRSTLGHRLYLARIGLVDTEGSVIIDSVTNVPFGQYVASNTLLSARLAERANPGAEGGAPIQLHKGPDTRAVRDIGRFISSGTCRVNLNAGSFKNKAIYSDEIIHGLGLGSVTIILGTPMPDGGVIYGNNELFRDEGAVFETAAKLNPTKGSFVIGIRALTTLVADYVDVKWTAIRDVDENVTERSNMKIMIKPNSLVIKPRDSKYLEAVCANMTNKTIRWSISPENGGEIDANGLYTAPNIEGVYEVIAQSAVYPEIKASIMVVVRE
ncbi:MAG: hypothetical protein IJT87_01740 [Ruminiclostridium sp.]|nr:hypothetical protein [Ruminiclostridium sp.]